MTHPAHESGVRISRVHCVAIRKEIGERLWTRRDQELVRLPPRLLVLMERLREDRGRNSAKPSA